MCTLNSFECGTFEDETIENTITVSGSRSATVRVSNAKLLCKKCGSEQVEISLRNKCEYCKPCFLSASMHKFKAILGKSKSMRPTDSVLIAHSGKTNSTALVQLIKNNANESSCKKLRFKCKILYIDDGIAKGFSLGERKDIRNALVKEADNLQIAMYITSLTTSTNDILCTEVKSTDVSQTNTIHDDEFIEKLFHSMESETAKDELLRQLKRKLIIRAARKLNCNKVFVADTSVDLATKVLADISMGRGSQVSLNVSFSDTRSADVTLLRPLREFTQDEIDSYLECCDVTPILACSKYNQSYPGSIRTVARNFIHQLDSNLNGTVSTVYRTSEKLAAKMKELRNVKIARNVDFVEDVNETCVLCELTLDSSNSQEKLSAVQAKIFSQLISTNVDPATGMASGNRSKDKQMQDINDSVIKHCRCDNTACISFHTESLQPELIETHLCYGCKLISLNSKEKYNLLSCFLYEKIQEKLQITHMQEEIAEFLL
ncbi:cytosolic thiouridylase subunit 2 [Lasioglossum baleicum]|uniref:cytosolic thiouridylase subunit 2 n=1 Tax=Lasioglossum baleicum TaxID=434251 RepID=UPI003FCE41FE